MLNQCQFIGHLGADPELKRTSDGRPIANLRLAVTEKWKSKETGELRERTEWIRIVIFSEGLCRVAEQYLKKGSKIYVSGKWQTRKWQNQEGKDQYSTECVLQGFDSKLIMLDSRTDSQPNTGNEYADQSTGNKSFAPDPKLGANGEYDDEIPFNCEWRA
jgi:single-strand DNA-binding protein